MFLKILLKLGGWEGAGRELGGLIYGNLSQEFSKTQHISHDQISLLTFFKKINK